MGFINFILSLIIVTAITSIGAFIGLMLIYLNPKLELIAILTPVISAAVGVLLAIEFSEWFYNKTK